MSVVVHGSLFLNFVGRTDGPCGGGVHKYKMDVNTGDWTLVAVGCIGSGRVT